MIRVVIADDHRIVRDGLQALLDNAPDVEVVGAAADGDEAIDICAAVQPHVVLMDLSMPNLGGVDATRRIVLANPGVRVVVLTAFSDSTQVLEALDAGAAGYLLKDAEPEDVVRAVRSAARGDAPLDPRAARAVLTARTTRPSMPDELTPREREVLVLVAEGLANKLIARRLGISEKTVKTHLTNIFQRIGVTDRTQAALWAQRHGTTAGGTRDAS